MLYANDRVKVKINNNEDVTKEKEIKLQKKENKKAKPIIKYDELLSDKRVYLFQPFSVLSIYNPKKLPQ